MLENINQRVENSLKAQLAELTEENEILLEQIFSLQNELKKHKPQLHTNALKNENVRLQALVTAYSLLRFSEMHNTLQYRVGNAIIQLKASLLKAPFKLIPVILFFTKKTPPTCFGGKNFTKVLSLYDQKGKEEVKNLIKSTKTTSTIKANAYTALSKHTQKTNLCASIEFAQHAYKTDPQPYRLKWWILRLSEFGDRNTAKALLELLPPDTTTSNSVNQLFEKLRKAPYKS